MRFPNRQSGFNLIGLIVTLGFVLAIITQVMLSRADMLRSAFKLNATDSYQNMLEGFTAYLSDQVSKNFSAICHGNTAFIQNLSFSGSTMNQTTSISLPAPLLNGEPELPERCRRPAFAANGRLYFCLNVIKSPDLPAQSFGGGDYGYVEVAVRAVDVWQRGINCATYSSAAAGQAGLQLYYRAYWANSPRENELKKRSGYYYAIKRSQAF